MSHAAAAQVAPQVPPLTNSLRLNFSWTLAGNVVYAACQWLMLIVLARLGTAGDVGAFSLGLAFTAPIFLLSQLQLRAIQVTDADRRFSFPEYAGLRAIATVAALGVTLAGAAISGYGVALTNLIFLVGVAKSIDSITDIYQGLLQQHEAMDLVAKSMLLKGPLSLAALTLGFWVSGSVAWAVAAMALASAAAHVFYVMPVTKGLRRRLPTNLHESPLINSVIREDSWGFVGKADPGVRWPLIRELFWLALPMGLVMALISLNSNIPRYFIERWFGTESLGVFSAAAYLVVAGNMVLFALCQSASPRLARYFRAGELGSFRRLIGRMLLLSVVLGGLGIAFALLAGAAALRILYGPAYAEHGMLLTWLMVAAAVGYVGSAIGFGMTAARRLRSQLPIFAGAAAVSAAACYVFIPRYGLNGAAYALLGAAMVQVAAGAGVLYSAIRKAAVGEIRP